jgi:hypothetical protein
MCPPSDATQLAVFYANRAACQAALVRIPHPSLFFFIFLFLVVAWELGENKKYGG